MPPRLVVTTWYVAMVTGRISFLAPGVLTDLLGGQRGPAQQLVPPLPGRHGVGHQDQRGRLGEGHRRRPDQGLAGPAGQHDDAGAAVPEGIGGHLLVRPQGPVLLRQRDRMGLAVHVAGEVLGRPAQLEQDLLEVPALGGMHHHGVGVEPVADQPLDLGAAQHLGEHGLVGADQHQALGRVLLQSQPPVPVHGVGDVDQQRRRHGIAAVASAGRRRPARRRDRRPGRSTARAASAGRCARAPALAPVPRTGRSPSGRRRRRGDRPRAAGCDPTGRSTGRRGRPGISCFRRRRVEALRSYGVGDARARASEWSSVARGLGVYRRRAPESAWSPTRVAGLALVSRPRRPPVPAPRVVSRRR